MTTYNRILFVADRTTADNTNALERAVELADVDGAELTIMDTVERISTNDPSLENLIDQMQQRMISDREKELQDVARQVDAPNAAILVKPGKDIVEITSAVLERGSDLVIKSSISSRLGHVIWGSLDLKLMRMCPAPVSLIREDQREAPARVVAAIDAMGDSDMARRILRTASSLASLENAELHVITVLLRDLWFHPHLPLTAGVDRKYRTDCEARFDELLADMPVQVTKQILEGEPADRILDYVGRNDLVVAGTVARRGLPGLLMGNTAEMIFNALRTSVLTVQPEDFQSPVAKAA